MFYEVLLLATGISQGTLFLGVSQSLDVLSSVESDAFGSNNNNNHSEIPSSGAGKWSLYFACCGFGSTAIL